MMVETTGHIVITSISVIISVLAIRLLVDFIISLANLKVNRENLIYSFLINITEPFCKPFNRLLPQNGDMGMSCIFAIASLYTVSGLLGGIFSELAKII